MKIKKYSDLEKIEDNMIVDLTELDSTMTKRAIDFLAGLICKNGSLTKLESGKFLVKMKGR